MKVVLSRVYELNEKQEELIKEISLECNLSHKETVVELLMDGELDLINFDEKEDMVLFVGEAI